MRGNMVSSREYKYFYVDDRALKDELAGKDMDNRKYLKCIATLEQKQRAHKQDEDDLVEVRNVMIANY